MLPEFLIPELNNPSGASGSPEVTLWSEAFQVHFTVSPGWIETLEGEKISLAPGATSTSNVVAEATPAVAKKKIASPAGRRALSLRFVGVNISWLSAVE